MNNLTALITGASSGIGAEFAKRLSENKYNTILVARRKEKLENLSKQLSEKYNTKSDYLTADLTKKQDIKKVQDYIINLNKLDFLINNAGFGIPKNFHEADLEKQLDMINLHIIAPTCLTYSAIPKMINQKKGTIINVSSLASLIPKPRSSIYSATKSYLTTFSQNLNLTLKDRGIKIQALCPGFTHSDFYQTKEYEKWDKTKIPKFLWMSIEDVVDSSLKALKKDKVIHIPSYKNNLLLHVMNNKLLAKLIWKYQEKKYQ